MLETLALVKSGYLLESLSIPRYVEFSDRVRMCWVLTISRKDSNELLVRESSETIRQTPAEAGEDRVRSAWRHAEGGRNVRPAPRQFKRSDNRMSEIPCRVSSDLHEWRTDRTTVLASGSANLWFR